MPVQVRADTFEAEVLRARLPVLVDVFGERCAPCRLLRPTLLEIEEEYAGQLKICMLNTGRESGENEKEYEDKFRIILTYGVRGVPTMLLFTGGELRRALVGLHAKEELLGILREEGLALTPRKVDEKDPGGGQEGGSD